MKNKDKKYGGRRILQRNSAAYQPSDEFWNCFFSGIPCQPYCLISLQNYIPFTQLDDATELTENSHFNYRHSFIQILQNYSMSYILKNIALVDKINQYHFDNSTNLFRLLLLHYFFRVFQNITYLKQFYFIPLFSTKLQNPFFQLFILFELYSTMKCFFIIF